MFAVKVIALLTAVVAVAAQPNCPIPSYPVSCDDDASICAPNQICVRDVRVPSDIFVRVCVPIEPCRYTGPNQQSNCPSADKYCYQTDVGNYCLLHPLCP